MKLMSVLFQVLEEFSRQVESIDWPSGNPDTINYKGLDIHLSKYQVSFNLCISNSVKGNPDCSIEICSEVNMKF